MSLTAPCYPLLNNFLFLFSTSTFKLFRVLSKLCHKLVVEGRNKHKHIHKVAPKIVQWKNCPMARPHTHADMHTHKQICTHTQKSDGTHCNIREDFAVDFKPLSYPRHSLVCQTCHLEVDLSKLSDRRLECVLTAKAWWLDKFTVGLYRTGRTSCTMNVTRTCNDLVSVAKMSSLVT